jgi:hypothetical protein
MARFDLDAIEPLDFDLSRFVPGLAGTIPEPSQDEIQAFFEAVSSAQLTLIGLQEKLDAESETRLKRSWARKHKDTPFDLQQARNEEPAAAVAERMAANSEANKATRDQANLIAWRAVEAITHGVVTADHMAALPFRHREYFLGWLAGNFSPEALAAATNG